MTRLADVASGLTDASMSFELTGDAEVTGVEHRTAAVREGTLFCCVPGRRVDGHDFAADAVRAGAASLLVERRLDLDVPQLVVGDVRRAMGPVAARFWGDPSRDLTVIGVTGTNGKTTTVALLAAIFAGAGRPSRVIGTLTSTGDGPPTTPDAPELQAELAHWRDEGVEVVAVEVSSHALSMGRVDGTRFAAAVFTTLGHDHLDLHGDIEEYFAAKAELFRPERTDRAVICRDGEWGGRLERLATSRGLESRTYGTADLRTLRSTASGSEFAWRDRSVTVPMPGTHNALNALAALTTATWLGLDPDEAIAALAAAPGVRGRLEVVDRGQPFTVVVDYAHTPDALAAAVAAARQQADVLGGRVITVFGCGGDKDRAKRPEMGRVAQIGSDIVVVTSDNPRSEDPDAIIEAIVAGMAETPRAETIADRGRAIHHAIDLARDHDVVLIAGKGHETTQTLADAVIPFDDVEVAAEAIAARSGSGDAS